MCYIKCTDFFFFFKAELSTAEQGPSLITLQQLIPDFTAMQPHINTGLVALCTSEWAASSITLQQSNCEHGCRFFGRVPWSARHTVCSVNWSCLFSICTRLVCWRKYISLCTSSHQPISVTPSEPSFHFLLPPTFFYSSFYFSFLS